jgi:hypothetical protein
MSLWPHEHGAYGQVSFPLLTAFLVGGVTPASALVAVAVLAGFMAHEPASVLLGLRGPRARRDAGAKAKRWLAVCAAAGIVAAAGAVRAMPAGTHWSLAVPLLPALVLLAAMLSGRERSWYGEAAAALAFAGASVPTALAGGAGAEQAFGIAIPFALLFLTTTLAVRVVILRVRGGGDPRAAGATRNSTLALSLGGAVGLGALPTAGLLSPWILVAAAPGLLVAAGLALYPPPPAKLRRVGWTLVAVSVLTVALVVATV